VYKLILMDGQTRDHDHGALSATVAWPRRSHATIKHFLPTLDMMM